MGSLAPAKRLAGIQMLSYSIPASAKREKQNHFTLLASYREALLAINLNIKCLNTLHVSLLPVQAIGVAFLKEEVLQRR